MKHPESDNHFYLFNQSLAYFTGLMTVFSATPVGIIIFWKRKSWEWMTTLTFIALGIPDHLLMEIPILIF
jgi:ABC-type dipeptide/oligopeptide/nickel transport system permease component